MNLDFITDTNAPLTRQQHIICELWELICKHDDLDFDTTHLKYIDELYLHTVGSLTYYNSEIMSTDDDLAAIVAAFNLLRGCGDRVFYSPSHFDFMQQEELNEEMIQDGCGVREDDEEEWED